VRVGVMGPYSTRDGAGLSAFPASRAAGRGARTLSGRDVDSCANGGVLDGLLHACLEKLVCHPHRLRLGILEDPGQVLD
jgi:hypothetical protein